MNKYAPIEHESLTEAPYVLLSLAESNGSLTLMLEGARGTGVSVCFDGHVFYSKMDEGDALHTVHELKQSSCIGATLIEAFDSELLHWFSRESFGVRSGNVLTHYVLLTLDDVVNVISLDPPKISLGWSAKNDV